MMDLPSRPLLVFKHNPKAGGGSALSLLAEWKKVYTYRRLQESSRCQKKQQRPNTAKNNQRNLQSNLSLVHTQDNHPSNHDNWNRVVDNKDFHSHTIIDPASLEDTTKTFDNSTALPNRRRLDADHVIQSENGVDKKECVHKFRDMIGRNDTLVYIPEFLNVKEIPFQKDAFVISSIREPCDQYLSLWAWGSTRKGALYDGFHKREPVAARRAYGKDAPYFDTQRDIKAFQHKWLTHERVQGLIAKRHDQSFGPLHEGYGLDQYGVDCWIYVDDYQATFYTCLREYEAQGGVCLLYTSPSPRD